VRLEGRLGMISRHDLALLRLVAQRICAPDFDAAHDVVRWLTATQGQDLAGAITAIAIRATKADRAGVEADFDAGRIVRSWPMRGTLHVVAAEDLGWLLSLTSPRTLTSVAARQEQLGLDAGTLGKVESLVVAALRGGNQLSRAGVLAVLDAGGVESTAGRGYHMQFHLAQLGIVCFGPMSGSEQQVVLVDEWIPKPRVLDRDEALAELAIRYFRSHGPATVKDFSRWTNLIAADVKIGVAAARDQLERIEVDGAEYLMDPSTPDRRQSCGADVAGVFLLPGFDEFVLGYGDRSAILDPGFADRIVPGANGVFRPTVVSDGRIVGTWTHAGRGAKRTLAVTPFTAFTKKVESATAKAYQRLP
jgi:hypothetical protein